jgi:WD40 repeat protein
LAIVFALFGVVTLLAAAAAVWLRNTALEQRAIAVAQRDRAEAALRSSALANLRVGSVISPDGTRLLALDPNGRVRVFDLASGRVIGEISMGDGEITSVAFSPDGKRIATGGTTKEIWIWDTSSLLETTALQGATDTIRRVAFSPDGILVAAGGDDKVVRIWSAQTGNVKFAIGVSDSVVTLAFRLNGKSLTISTSDGSFYEVDSTTGKITTMAIQG